MEIQSILKPYDGKRSPMKAVGLKRGGLVKKFAKAGFKKGAEIGVAYGRFSAHMCKYIPDIELICVDTWMTYLNNPRATDQKKHDENFARAKKSMEGYNVKFLDMFSTQAVGLVDDGYLDFVYIDGNHKFDYVMTDLIMWSRKVKKGGIISGHDYYKFRRAEVVPAVNIYVEMHKIKKWYLTDERTPSFFWVKE